MSNRFRWIPFRWLPASWGLNGRLREEAEANYYLTGEMLEDAIIEIRYRDQPEILFNKRLEYDLKRGKITAFESAEISLRRRQPDVESIEYKLELLDIEFANNKITKNEYEKSRALLTDEPWVGIVYSGFDPDHGLSGFSIELDWTPGWIEYLRLHGYVGMNDEDIVEQWFSDVCKSQVYSDNITVLDSRRTSLI